MDTSEQYIKMCDCDEIQEPERWLLFRPKKLDCLVWSGADVFFDGKEKLVWLPRQDQLQEMIELWHYCSNEVSSLAWGVWNFYTHSDDNYFPDSMEQLWLAFVMKEKFNKTWDGDKWTN
ncbi:hypothetical protein LCGC14_2766710 [marine sediment metagenome]|uniref:Uncharacterized protein n=1 Tax=marine sediment metagenome TaxID=412755 RepID=A0A0F8ZJ69_9ZZZZ